MDLLVRNNSSSPHPHLAFGTPLPLPIRLTCYLPWFPCVPWFSSTFKCLSVVPVSGGHEIGRELGRVENCGRQWGACTEPHSLCLCACRGLPQASYDIREQTARSFEIQPDLSFLLHFANWGCFFFLWYTIRNWKGPRYSQLTIPARSNSLLPFSVSTWSLLRTQMLIYDKWNPGQTVFPMKSYLKITSTKWQLLRIELIHNN